MQNQTHPGVFITCAVTGGGNTVGKSDGEKAFWINGKKVGHWRPGEPVGSWIRDKFVTSGNFNKNPGPFEGFDFRSAEDVRFSEIALRFVESGRFGAPVPFTVRRS